MVWVGFHGLGLGMDLFELSVYGQLCVLSELSIELGDYSLGWFCMD